MLKFEDNSGANIPVEEIDWDQKFTIRKIRDDAPKQLVESLASGWDRSIPAIVRRPFPGEETNCPFIGVVGFRRSRIFIGLTIPCLVAIFEDLESVKRFQTCQSEPKTEGFKPMTNQERMDALKAILELMPEDQQTNTIRRLLDLVIAVKSGTEEVMFKVGKFEVQLLICEDGQTLGISVNHSGNPESVRDFNVNPDLTYLVG